MLRTLYEGRTSQTHGDLFGVIHYFRDSRLPSGFRFDHDLEMILPECGDEGEQPKRATSKPAKMYSGYCLRPYPASRGNYAVDYSRKANVKMRKGASQIEQEDAFLLKIIEGYCSSSHGSRSNKVGSGGKQPSDAFQPPQLLVAEDEKIFVEEMIGDEIVVHERTLVDTVYALKDQINNLQREVRQLSKTVEREQKARRRLEELVRRFNDQYSASSTPKPSAESVDYEQSALQIKSQV
ncbi:unnamed protein product [Toxocara canis]|uniref:BetaPIX_CC domain-containing protein n=1 Tax=Toxocara canis TaxID=6265 RepID=A0A183UYW5_TOXCA|nr:unnamed protein product [Toxocara canis]